MPFSQNFSFTQKEKKRLYSKNYRKNNKEKIAARQKIYYENNKEKLIQYKKDIYQANDLSFFLSNLLSKTKHRAKNKGIEFDLSVFYIANRLIQINCMCELTGQVLTHEHNQPNTLSIDRIDSNKGYTKDNVQIVTYMANTAKNKWAQKDFITMCKMVVEKFA